MNDSPPTTTTAAPPVASWLPRVIEARAAMEKAAADTALAADELRRYQKFARPGQPTAHIVQLRQKQAAARQASARAKQAFIKASMEFMRERAMTLPPKVDLGSFMLDWLKSVETPAI